MTPEVITEVNAEVNSEVTAVAIAEVTAEVVHRLGAALCGTAGAWCLATAVSAWRRERRLLRRLDATLDRVRATGPGRPGAAGARAGPGIGSRAGVRTDTDTCTDTCAGAGAGVLAVWRGAVRRWLPVAGAASAGYVLVGGVPGVLVGALAGFAAWRWQRRPVPVEEFDSGRAVRELPLAADLLAACIVAGADPVTASRAVGESLGGPVGERLARGAAEVRLGAEPRAAWRGLAALPGADGLARLLERAGDSGAPAAEPVARLAAEARSEWGREATARARRAGVLITAPVGLCFLPAFIAVGVLPVVIGLAGGLLNGSGG